MYACIRAHNPDDPQIKHTGRSRDIVRILALISSISELHTAPHLSPSPLQRLGAIAIVALLLSDSSNSCVVISCLFGQSP